MRKLLGNIFGYTKLNNEIDRLKKIIGLMQEEANQDELLIQKYQAEGAASQKRVDEINLEVSNLERVIAFENDDSTAHMQPIEFVQGVPHFKGNSLIQKIMHEMRGGGYTLDGVLRWNAHSEEKEQLLQLMGVSVSSYQKQGHVSLRSQTAVRVRVRDLKVREEARKAGRPAVLSHKPFPGGKPQYDARDIHAAAYHELLNGRPLGTSMAQAYRDNPVIAEGIVAQRALAAVGIDSLTPEGAALLASASIVNTMKEQGVCLDMAKATETAVELAAKGDGFYAGGNLMGISDGPIQRQICSSPAMGAPYGTSSQPAVESPRVDVYEPTHSEPSYTDNSSAVDSSTY